MKIKGGDLPKGDGNGLEPHHVSLINDMSTMRACVILLDTDHVTIGHDGEKEATVRVRRVELITEDEDKKILGLMLRRALDGRLGRQALPFDLETEVRSVFPDAWPEDPPADPRVFGDGDHDPDDPGHDD